MTSFADQIDALAGRSKSLEGKLQTEEATKTALVMPFLQALGYDIFDPTAVIPEFTADHGIKKGEKVDYAIMIDGQLTMLIECKTYGADLSSAGASQLYRYFSVTDARIGILTNGVEYWFYSDLDKNNTMDKEPFFRFDMGDYIQSSTKELERFRKEVFSIEVVLNSATDLKYRGMIEAQIQKEIEAPSDEFIEIMARRVYEGRRLTAQVREWFGQLVQQAMKATIRAEVNKRLSNALKAGNGEYSEVDEAAEEPKDEDGIDTTEEELEAFQIVRAILRTEVDVSRIYIRDQKSYCGILLDDNNRKPICRLHFNSKSKKHLGVFKDKEETRIEISSLEDIFQHADRLMETVRAYN
ncbi:type I restriction endonuclease [Thalassobaculum sp.]|uniref:type I restriction endonuclease n=1 Tax=Thalassobaculum sp. TaxID=2022740 RepID=UPI003B58BC3D